MFLKVEKTLAYNFFFFDDFIQNSSFSVIALIFPFSLCLSMAFGSCVNIKYPCDSEDAWDDA